MNAVDCIRPSFFQQLPGRMRRVLFSNNGTVLESIATHDNNYNLIRFALAAAVIFFHASYLAGSSAPDVLSSHLQPITDLGGLAVQCFFFLSGLFVSQSLSKDASLIDFSVKRFMRIFPGLFTCTVVCVVVLAAASCGWDFWKSLAIPDTYDYILKTGTLIHLQWSIPGVLLNNPVQTINGSIHTLPSELKMYVMLGLLGFAGLVRSKNYFRISAFALLSLMIVVGRPVLALWRVPDDAFAMVFLFIAGMLVYACADQIRINLAQGGVLIFALCLSGSVALLNAIALYAFVIWLMLYWGQLPWLRKLLHPRTDPSYGMYIYGWPSEQLVKIAYPAASANVVALAALFVAFGAALLSWKYIEKPCMDMGKDITQRRSSISELRASFSSGKHWVVSFRCQAALLVICLGLSWLTFRVNLLPTTMMAARIVDFGPKEIPARSGGDNKSGVDSALWLKLSSPPPAGAKVLFAGHYLDTTVSIQSSTVTAILPASLLNVGKKRIFLRGFVNQKMQQSNTVLMIVGH
ncbi:acyltransferase family protein [Rhodanobacter hydrolyticus]|uniref:Acyltransferase n=1 Tax=Rhodanobacter hydrolyticus TaxID=2250595 RepID=A0ABW8J8Y8_9GAMM